MVDLSGTRRTTRTNDTGLEAMRGSSQELLPMTRTLTRRAVALVLILSLGLFVGSLIGGAALAATSFTDVGPTHPFRTQIQWMADQGIAGGYPDGTYRGGEPVTRQAMAAFISRYNETYYLTQTGNDPAAASTFSASATCQVGDRAIAGGGRTDFANIFLTDSVPSDENERIWFVRFETDNDVSMDPTTITAWALCAPANEK
jgi:hypothetical protein